MQRPLLVSHRHEPEEPGSVQVLRAVSVGRGGLVAGPGRDRLVELVPEAAAVCRAAQSWRLREKVLCYEQATDPFGTIHAYVHVILYRSRYGA